MVLFTTFYCSRYDKNIVRCVENISIKEHIKIFGRHVTYPRICKFMKENTKGKWKCRYEKDKKLYE